MKRTPSYGVWYCCTMWIKSWLPSPQCGRGAGSEGDRCAVIGCLALRIQQACSASTLGLLLLLVLPSQAEVAFQDLLKMPAENWLSYSGDLTARRHSLLKQIN